MSQGEVTFGSKWNYSQQELSTRQHAWADRRLGERIDYKTDESRKKSKKSLVAYDLKRITETVNRASSLFSVGTSNGSLLGLRSIDGQIFQL